ncbi:hypothetical protein V1Y59_02060 [Gordonia sp. PKS22-38]|uniref:Uncharacterized protein n=1 Tax=Gordonia prachuapensis TaxID=3115651 RepID=A0ABU7MND9_9ACTN|nr:hypothetical protein [Gordonia sp. PKS22-38]
MNAPFGGRQRRRAHEPTLSELPAWGLEIMMGLYGPDTIERACAEEVTDNPAVGAELPDGSPVQNTSVRSTSVAYEADPGPVDPVFRGSPSGSSQDSQTVPPPSPLVIELEAINELVKYLERKLKRH